MKTKAEKYPALIDYIREPDGRYSAIARNWPGLLTYGDNLEEARHMAKDAAKGMADVLRAGHGQTPSHNFMKLKPRGTVHTELLMV